MSILSINENEKEKEKLWKVFLRVLGQNSPIMGEKMILTTFQKLSKMPFLLS